MELSREREQWAQRQEMHQAEAQSLRLQLQRLHEQQDMLAQSAQPPQHKALLDRIYQMEGELELVTQEKFALHERLLQSQAARAALSDQQPAHAGTDAAVLHEQLQRTKDAKSRAEAAHQEARALLTQVLLPPETRKFKTCTLLNCTWFSQAHRDARTAQPFPPKLTLRSRPQ